MLIVGCGAMNLDLIYKVEDIKDFKFDGVELLPGREIVLDHELANKLLKQLEKKGRFLGKSGGGSAANTICALTKLGHECYFVSSVGEDEAGDFLISQMRGVDCSFVKRCGNSSMCIIVIDKRSNDRSMIVVPGTFEVDLGQKGLRDILCQSNLFHFTSLVQKIGPSIQRNLLESLKEETIVSFDPGEVYAKIGYQMLKDLFSKTDLLFSTDYETKRLFLKTSEKEILKKILRRRKNTPNFIFFKEFPPPVFIKKKGSKGAEAFCLEKSIKVSAKKVEKVVDNTGAGDAFNAGVLHGILNEKPVKDALDYGVEIAAFSLTFPGRDWIDYL